MVAKNAFGRMIKKILCTVFIFFFKFQLIDAQDIVWSTRLMDYSKKFQTENNYASMAIGVPSIYPDTNLYNTCNINSEGYILHFNASEKLNMIKMGFNSPVMAQQIILGGVFNPGSIYSVDIILEDGRTKKNVYKFNEKYSIVKFHDFNVFLEPTKIYAIEVYFQHKFINSWNLLKGIGVINSGEALDLVPYQVTLDPTKIKKQLIDDNFQADGDCFLFAPEITPDGKTLYFVKECSRSKEGQDIWFSIQDEDGKWGEPQSIGKPLNNKSHNYVASVGSDGNFLLVGNKYNADGSFAGDGVSKSYKLSDNKWSVPQNIDIPNHVNYNENANYFLSEDEKYLIFASEDENSLGDLDLYVSIFNSTGRTWSEPIHLGKSINTTFSEDYPYLAKDGVTLYFSSKGHIGYGGHDVYMTQRLDDTWKNWSKPVNLGPLINTYSDDKGFIISSDGKHAYLNSASLEKANGIDIFRINLPEEFYQTEKHNYVKATSLKSPMKFEIK
jgi:hypothetical protein